METPEQHEKRHSGVFIINFEQISHKLLVFLFFDFKQVNADWIALFQN